MRKTILLLMFVSFSFSLSAQTLEVASPGNIVQLSFYIRDGVPYYSIKRFGREVIKPSRMGFILKDMQSLDKDFRITSSARNHFDETWTQPWGEKKDIRNNYNELTVKLERPSGTPSKMNITFRLYDDGLGFRYEIPEQEGLKKFEVMDELTEFAFTDDHMAWWIGAFWPNRYEYLYRHTPLSKADTVQTPFTMETSDGLFISMHEAALMDYPSMALKRTESFTYKAELYPWSDGTRVKAEVSLKTPWRTMQLSDDAGGLITSYLILNLNEPNKLGDVSWVQPGKYVGIWWAMHLGYYTWNPGPKHGATTENTRRYIDFASKYGFRGVLVEGWNLGWDGDWVKNGDQFNFSTPYPDYDFKGLADYAKQKGVYLIGHNETGGAIMNYERQLTDAFSLYEKLGIKAIKTGYVNWGRSIKRIDEEGNAQLEWHHGQYTVRHYQKVVEEAAKHHIMVDVHEPIKDTGLRRTFPNMMSREGARGEEYDAWGSEGGNPPEHTTILPFTRLLSGPMDFTPGIFALTFKDRPANRVNTTLARQLAHYVTIYSPLHMAADMIENYEANPKPFKFIQDVPTDWQDTRVLNASIGNYLTIVRQDRNSRDWYLGSITDEQGRILEAPLGFLEAGEKYVAEIYCDGQNADWRTNPYDIEITEMLVDNSMTLSLRLAAGGGEAIRFRPATEEDVKRLK
ncbi:MAG: glycoside hydrolase family 97 protein [Ignavibacteria bacterium]|nr:glycoside hydrolase family 97 protein [Ignavibacteria bacterium]MCU7516138.1 glycoside hydrolase family 97 protein [Ignavibacteria bacterium]